MKLKKNISKKEKALYLVIVVYFFLSSLLHFARLTFAWNFFVGDYSVPTVASGMCVIFSVAVLLLTVRILKEKNTITVEKPCKEDSDE